MPTRSNSTNHSDVWCNLAIRKRPTEADRQILPVAGIGAIHGVECPTTDSLAAMIPEIEFGERPLSNDILVEFMRG